MFPYKVEKICLRFYKYKFLNFDESEITIEAYNRKQARFILREFIINTVNNHECAVYLSSLNTNEIVSMLGISEKLSLPITGETLKTIDNVECVWAIDRWIPLWEYERSNLISKNKI